jgi:isopenicillin-N epimerase
MSAVHTPSDIPAIRPEAWGLDPAVMMLNHGSFGACPRPVLEAQQRLRAELEAEPVLFFERRMQPLLDESRATLAAVVGADPLDLVFVNNATAGVNAVLRSLRFQPGDELLATDHAYNACRNVLEFVAGRSGARLVVAPIRLPIESPQEIVEAVVSRTSGRTRLALVDHITSATAAAFPVEEIVRQLAVRGIDTLIDGAHAPGMIPLDIQRIGAAYYTATCHKWLCAPKGAGFLYVRRDRQEGIEPPVISHGFNTPRPGRSRFHTAFDWMGTDDPTPWLCVGEAIHFLGGLLDGASPVGRSPTASLPVRRSPTPSQAGRSKTPSYEGEQSGLAALMRRNHALAVLARRMLCEALPVRPTCPEAMIGSTAAFCLPDDPPEVAVDRALVGFSHPLHDVLLEQYGIEVPVYYWPSPPRKILRISAQAYNGAAQYARLVEALGELMP